MSIEVYQLLKNSWTMLITVKNILYNYILNILLVFGIFLNNVLGIFAQALHMFSLYHGYLCII